MLPPGSGGSDSAVVELRSGGTAPSFTAASLGGRTLQFPDDFRGKVVLLDFWATWCGPCRAEKPYLQEAQRKFAARGFVILGIPLDGDDIGKLQRFVRDQGLEWEQVTGKTAPAIAAKFGVTAVPAPFLINGDTGIILATGDDLRGGQLGITVQKNLRKDDRAARLFRKPTERSATNGV